MSALLKELLDCSSRGESCCLVTVAQVSGSAPREPGAKMIVFADGRISGTIGGGKFEALVVATALESLTEGRTILQTWPLHEASPDSFGAICGGEVTVLIEPQTPPARFCLIGAGHCAQALARLASDCGFAVIVVDDRSEKLGEPDYPASIRCLTQSPVDVIRSIPWTRRDALVLVSRSFEIDRDALGAALGSGNMGYLGMIGSDRKVRRVLSELVTAGIPEKLAAQVYAPIGLDIGADSPAEIAVSVLAEVLMVLRSATGQPLRLKPTNAEEPTA